MALLPPGAPIDVLTLDGVLIAIEDVSYGAIRLAVDGQSIRLSVSDARRLVRVLTGAVAALGAEISGEEGL